MFRAIPFKTGNRNLIRFTLSSNKNLGHTAAPAVANHHSVDHVSAHPRIGKREIVGFGHNGQPQYFDHASMPLPSVRWSENTPEISKLREKARGDWSSLTVDEKKALYRADFRQSFAELTRQSDGEWKYVTGFLLGLMGATLWLYVFVRSQIYNFPRKESSSLEHQTRMLERMIVEGKGRVHGISSEWDYVKGDWK